MDSKPRIGGWYSSWPLWFRHFLVEVEFRGVGELAGQTIVLEMGSVQVVEFHYIALTIQRDLQLELE